MLRHALLSGVLLLGGCSQLRRGKAPPPPPGPIPVRIPDQVTSTGRGSTPQTLPPPPAIETPTPDGKPSTEEAVGMPSLPVAVAVRTPRAAKPAVRRPTPEAAVPVAESATQEQPPSPPFRLGELRTAQEREALKRQTDDLLDRCSAAVAAADGRTLTPEQAELLSRVRTFAQQAREKMDTEPDEARSFAVKGRTFADALLALLK